MKLHTAKLLFLSFFAAFSQASVFAAPMVNPTSSNYPGISYGTAWTPSISAPPSNGNGDKVYQVTGQTNWRSSAWTPNVLGTFEFIVGQLAEPGHEGNIPSGPQGLGPMQINYETTYTVTVQPAPMDSPTSSSYYNVTKGVPWSPSISAPSSNGSGAKMFKVFNETSWQSDSWTPTAVGTYTFYVGQLADSNHQGSEVDPQVGPIQVNSTAYTVEVVALDYLLTVNSGAGDGSYTAGTQVPISADNPSLNRVFDNWGQVGLGTITNPNWHDTTFTMGSGDATLTANYRDATYSWTIPTSVPHNQPYDVSVSVGTSGGQPTVTLKKDGAPVASDVHSVLYNSADSGPDTIIYTATYSDPVKNSSGTSGNKTVTVDPPPPAPLPPSHSSPSNGSACLPLNQSISWSSSANAHSYEVYFGTSSNPSQVTTVTGTSYTPSALTAGTIYYWKIIAVGTGGDSSASSTWSFTTESLAPDIPNLASPSSNASCVSTGTRLNWYKANNAQEYWVYFGTSNPPPYAGTVSESGSGTLRNYDPPLNYNTTYYWKIVAVNDCWISVGSVRSFTTDATPSPSTPGLLSPADGASCLPTSEILDWSSSSYTDSYDVYFGTTSNPPKVGSTSSSSYSPTLQPGATYYWKIVAKNSCNDSASSIRSFSTSSDFNAPTTPVPAIDASCVPDGQQLSWDPATGATSYDVYFGTDPTPDNTEFRINQEGTSFNPGPLSPNITYYWQIASKNGDCEKLSPVWSFTASAAAPSAPSAPTPADGSIDLPQSLELSWTGSAESYDVYFGANPIPGAAEFIGNQTTTTYDPGYLVAGVTYYWQVIAKSGCQETPSPVWVLSTFNRINLAFGMIATQSSTSSGGDPARAIDGATDGDFANASVTATSSEIQPWWEVDLGADISIGDIEIWNRTDCCSDRLAAYDVSLLDENRNVIWTTYELGEAQRPTVVNAGNAFGRYVRIQLTGTNILSLAEVIVRGGAGSVSDVDADGLPDEWELLHGFSPSSSLGVNGAEGNPDGDALTNRIEFLFGTDPNVSTSTSSLTPEVEIHRPNGP